MASRAVEFEAFVGGHRSRLMHSALLLTAGDHHLAEDLVQTTLLRLYLAWPRVRRSNLEAYTRRALVNCLIDHTRRPFQRREVTTGHLPDTTIEDQTSHDLAGDPVVDPAGPPTASQALWQALRDLPPGMRAAVVLRHVEDLSVEDTARALNCSTGTVKSQTARGLEKIRASVGPTRTTATEGANECTT